MTRGWSKRKEWNREDKNKNWKETNGVGEKEREDQGKWGGWWILFIFLRSLEWLMEVFCWPLQHGSAPQTLTVYSTK